ncbi:MAG: hypothetical protein RIC36_15410 [Rhodospirillales bacterium]
MVSSRMRVYLMCWLFAVAALGIIVLQYVRIDNALGDTSLLTGYALYTTLVFLALFNLRKRLSMLPLGRASTWFALHIVIGLLSVVLFWLHTGTFWSLGLYEQVLMLLFYGACLTGITGYAIQRIIPARLIQTEYEVIFERIPGEIAEIRAEVESLILRCTDVSGADTLARHYTETADWYFRRPRFLLSHVFGTQAGEHWLHQNIGIVRRYLRDSELPYLDRLYELGQRKNRIDQHYALQGLMKIWLLAHLPLSTGLITLATWHLIIVHVYAL